MKYEILQLTGGGDPGVSGEDPTVTRPAPDTSAPGGEESGSAPPGTQAGPAGREDGAEAETEQPSEGDTSTQTGGAESQPSDREGDDTQPQQPARQEGDTQPQQPAREGDDTQPQQPAREGEDTQPQQPARQEAEAAGSGAAPSGEGREEERTHSGEEPLPEVDAVLSNGERAGEEGQSLVPTTLTQPSLPGGSGLGPALPFSLGVLAALGVTGLLLWLRRRRGSGALRLPAPPCRGFRCAQVHEVGARDSQQDAFCLAGLESPEGGVLAAVADGMGGLVDSGQVSRALTDALGGSFAPGGTDAPARQLQLLLQQALDQVEDLQKGRTAQSGSTLVMCLIREGALSWLSVGDSRIYLWRGGGLIQLNRDHDFHHDLTLLAMQKDMTFAEADQDPRRENLTSYIGGGFPRKVEWNPEPIPLRAGDRVVLMSDGVYRALSQEEMAWCLGGDAQAAADALRAAVTEKSLPQQDNFTAVILEATGP